MVALSDPTSTGPPLARLFAIAYRQLVVDLHDQLAARGWTDVRPAYGFVLLALRDGSATATEVGVLTGTSKQASSQLVAAMIAGGYVVQAGVAPDGRARPLGLSARGRELLATVEEIYRTLEARWADRIGAARVEELRADLVAALRDADGSLPPVRPLW